MQFMKWMLALAPTCMALTFSIVAPSPALAAGKASKAVEAALKTFDSFEKAQAEDDGSRAKSKVRDTQFESITKDFSSTQLLELAVLCSKECAASDAVELRKRHRYFDEMRTLAIIKIGKMNNVEAHLALDMAYKLLHPDGGLALTWHTAKEHQIDWCIAAFQRIIEDSKLQKQTSSLDKLKAAAKFTVQQAASPWPRKQKVLEEVLNNLKKDTSAEAQQCLAKLRLTVAGMQTISAF